MQGALRLRLAWCNGGGCVGVIAGGVVGVASGQFHLATKPMQHLHDPSAKHRHLHLPPQFTRQDVKLCVPSNGSSQDDADTATAVVEDVSTDNMTLQKASKLLSTFWSMAFPYYQESQAGRRLFYGMIVFTLMNSSVSVAFSYISKDFWNALSNKDTAEFYSKMLKFGGALVVGAPVEVFYRSVLIHI